MMRITRSALATLLLFNPTLAAAQSSLRLELTPQVGWYAPLRELGAVAPAVSYWYLKLERTEASPFVGGNVRLARPGSRLSARLHGGVALPSSARGFFDCYPGLACPAVLMNTKADVTVLTAGADLLYAAAADGARVRPYVIAGAGLKRYHFSWLDAVVMVPAGEYDESALALRGGLGVEMSVAGAPLRLEASDYWSGEGRGLQGTGTDQLLRPARKVQHDLAISLGWSMLRF